MIQTDQPNLAEVSKKTQIRVCLPEGRSVQFMGTELKFAEGDCLIVTVPPLGKIYVKQFVNAVQEAGGTVTFL